MKYIKGNKKMIINITRVIKTTVILLLVFMMPVIAAKAAEPVTKNPVTAGEDPQTKISKGIKVDISDIIEAEKNKAKTSASTSSKSKKTNKSKTSDGKTPVADESLITYGIDVAKWQGIIDWKKVKESGVEFAMIRVGYRTLVTGEICEDPYAEYNLQQARDNGIKIGVYFFSTAVNRKEAVEEAAWVTEFIGPYPITYPVVYNCEGYSDAKSRQHKLNKKERTRLAEVFLDYIKGQGYIPMFYASKNELDNNAEWNTTDLNDNYKIWVAQYTQSKYNDKSKSSYKGRHDMWQFTSMGQVTGIDNQVDINVAYFGFNSIAKAKKETPRDEAIADPAALLQFKEVNETVTAKKETNLRSAPSTKDKDTIVYTLKNGETVIRTGLSDSGWSRLLYNGQTVYAVSSYLTTDMNYKENNAATNENPEAGIKFTDTNEKVTAKEKTNLRTVPNTESEDTIVAVLYNGDLAIRTGFGDNGWSRIEYNGQVLYAVSSYLIPIENK
jgi:GH25 family lysozyme M1 (1,4-beta-N-acetylmuramidase)